MAKIDRNTNVCEDSVLQNLLMEQGFNPSHVMPAGGNALPLKTVGVWVVANPGRVEFPIQDEVIDLVRSAQRKLFACSLIW